MYVISKVATNFSPKPALGQTSLRPLAEWKRLAQQVKNGIGYLRDRLTGACREANYN